MSSRILAIGLLSGAMFVAVITPSQASLRAARRMYSDALRKQQQAEKKVMEQVARNQAEFAKQAQAAAAERKARLRALFEKQREEAKERNRLRVESLKRKRAEEIASGRVSKSESSSPIRDALREFVKTNVQNKKS
jgi:IS5 family transposase